MTNRELNKKEIEDFFVGKIYVVDPKDTYFGKLHNKRMYLISDALLINDVILELQCYNLIDNDTGKITLYHRTFTELMSSGVYETENTIKTLVG